MKASIKQSKTTEGWSTTLPKETSFTSDKVIDAFLHGKKTALEQANALILEQLKQHISLTGTHTHTIINFLHSIGVQPLGAYLKINSWSNFTLLIIVSEADFLKPEMLNAYQFLSAFESQVRTDLYTLDVTFCDFKNRKAIRHDAIISDGYVLRFTALE